MRSVEEVRIGLVKDNTANTGKLRGGKMSQQNNKIHSKFLRSNQPEGRKNDTLFMKDVDEFILD